MPHSFSVARRAIGFGAAMVLLAMAGCGQGPPQPCLSASLSPIPTTPPLLSLSVYILGCDGGEGCKFKFNPNDIYAQASDLVVAHNNAGVEVAMSDSTGCPAATIGVGASRQLQTPTTGTFQYVVYAAGSTRPVTPPGQSVLRVHAQAKT
jgi:hypothetical protein